MTRRPDVRRVNMLSEYRNPDEEHGTNAFYRALSEADGFIHQIEHAAELACRCDELTQLVDDIKHLHRPQRNRIGLPVCRWCKVISPCPTMQLIERNT